MLEPNAHVYSFAWNDEDNPDQHLRIGLEPKWWRVFRYYPNHKHPSHPVTEPMSRAEAKAKCADIIKLTGGRKLL